MDITNKKNILSYKKNSLINKSNDKNIIVNYNCFCSKVFLGGEKLL